MKKKMMILMCSGECACVCASVKCCFLFIFFNCIYYLCKKEKNSLMVKQMQNFQQDLIWFAHRKGESPVSFSGTEYRERERKHTFIFATLSASEMSAFPGEDRREKWDILRPWNGLISAAARSEFVFFLFNQFFASLQVWICGRIDENPRGWNKRK